MRSDIRVCSLSPHGLYLHHIGEGIIVWAERRKTFYPSILQILLPDMRDIMVERMKNGINSFIV